MSESTPTESSPTFYTTLQEHAEKLQKYLTNAENSIKQLETNINSATAQIQEAKKLQFAVMGQRDLLKSLLSELLNPKAGEEKSS